jgi:hypothetical protein
MTQREEILLYIKEHGSITPLDAYPLGITKLATRVSEMRKDGIILKHTMEKGKNKNGKPMRYMRYSFPKGAEQ